MARTRIASVHEIRRGGVEIRGSAHEIQGGADEIRGETAPRDET